MTRAKNKLIVTLLALMTAFSLTACTNQKDVDKAVKPLSAQITTINATLTEMQTLDTTLDGYIDTLKTKVETLETDLATVNANLETLEENSATKTALTETKTALENEITTIKTEIENLKSKDTELDGKITVLQTAVNNGLSDIEETYATKAACETLKTEIYASISALDGRVETLGTTVSALDETVAALQTQVEENKEDITELKNRVEELNTRLNCLEGKHELIDCVYNDDDTHTGTCENCAGTFTNDCTYSDWVSNADGTRSKTCSTCNNTIIERINVTVTLKEGASLTKYWEDDLTLDLSTLIDITEGAGEATYTLTSSTVSGGSISGSILSCPLIGDYTITVTTAETATHNAAAFTFTVKIETNPATGGFDGEWITF